MEYKIFELCDFKPEEVDRAKRAFELWQIGPEKLRESEKRIEVFDLQLEGIRKLIAAYVREIVDVILANREGRKVLFTNVPATLPQIVAPALMSKNVVSCSGGLMNVSALSFLFGYEVLLPPLEAAEERGMTAGEAHCSINKLRMGARALGWVAPADLMISWGLYCDESPKMSEALHELFGDYAVYIDQSQSDQDMEYPDADPIALEYLASELHKLRRETEKTVGFRISDDNIKEAANFLGELREMYLKITELLKADPIPLNYPDLMLVEGANARIMTNVPAVVEAEKILYEELKKRIDEGKGVGNKGLPRVLKSINSPYADPSLLDINKLGLAIPISENYLLYIARMRRLAKAVDKKEGEFMEGVAESLLLAGYLGSTRRRMDDIIPACREWNIEGLLWMVNYECRPMYLQAMEVKKAAAETLGIPCLILEMDPYDFREYSAQQIRTRLEAFAEMLKINKKN